MGVGPGVNLPRHLRCASQNFTTRWPFWPDGLWHRRQDEKIRRSKKETKMENEKATGSLLGKKALGLEGCSETLELRPRARMRLLVRPSHRGLVWAARPPTELQASVQASSSSHAHADSACKHQFCCPFLILCILHHSYLQFLVASLGLCTSNCLSPDIPFTDCPV